MKVSLFFRKTETRFHSIENLFYIIGINFPEQVKVENIFAKYISSGFVRRILIGLHARKHQSEINHITGHNHFIALFLKKNNTILTIHDIGSIKYGNSIKRKIIQWFWFDFPMKRVARVTVISEFTKKELLKYTKQDADKIIVIPNCVSEIYKYSEKEFNLQKPNILQIGTKKNKNLNRLIKALKKVNCKLSIVGELSNEQLSLLLGNKIEYENLYNLSEVEMYRAYCRADMVSFVSTYEGFGMPIIEANAVGRVVLSSNIEPMASVAANAGLKVNPFDVESIRKGLITLIENKTLREGLINNGIENAKQYSAKTIANQYFNIYQEVLGNKEEFFGENFIK